MGVLNSLSFKYPDWHDRASCRRYDPKYWLNSAPNSKNRRFALDICNTQCEVRRQCLRWILELEGRNGTTDSGVYGGKSEHERKKIRMRWYAIFQTHPYQEHFVRKPRNTETSAGSTDVSLPTAG